MQTIKEQPAEGKTWCNSQIHSRSKYSVKEAYQILTMEKAKYTSVNTLIL